MPAEQRRRALAAHPVLLVVLGVAVVAAIVVGGMRLGSEFHGGPPYGASDVSPGLSGFGVLPGTHAGRVRMVADITRLGGTAADIPVRLSPDRLYAVGRLDIEGRFAPAGSVYDLVVVDNRTHQASEQAFAAATGVRALGVSQGSDPALRSAFSKFSWLHVTNPEQAESIETRAGAATTQLPFFAALPVNALPLDKSGEDITVGLVFSGSDNQIWWGTHFDY
jgi:hypothetical protein